MTPTPRPGNDWRVYAYTKAGHVVLLSTGMDEDRATTNLEELNQDLGKAERFGPTVTIAGNRGTVLLSMVEAFAIKNHQWVGR